LADVTELYADCIRHKALLESITSNLPHSAFVLTFDRQVIWQNDAAAQLEQGASGEDACQGLCYGKRELCGKIGYPCPVEHIKETGQSLKVLHERTGSDGKTRHFELHASPLLTADGESIGVIGSLNDVSEYQTALTLLREKDAMLMELSRHDSLTGLANRGLAMERLDFAIRRARRSGHLVGVIYLDLNQFKQINDSMGHEIGDAVLVKLAKRMAVAVRSEDTVARLGGDEFIVILDRIDTPEGANQVAKKLQLAIGEPMLFGSRMLNNSANLGISLFPRNGDDAETLLKNANAAMCRAKQTGGGKPQFFDESADNATMEKMSLEFNLRKSLEVANESDFFLLYQPVVDLADSKVVKVEALLRWNHPELGIIAPAHFLSIAEESGLIRSLDDWVLLTACNQLVAWHNQGFNLPRISVNLSAKGLLRGDFPGKLSRILAITGCPVAGLELELSEVSVMSDADTTREVLRKLGNMGVTISIDDFGTGFTSLSNLKLWPVNQLKLDRSIVKELPGNDHDAALARAILALGKSLQLNVVAEGIETEAQREFLIQEGCLQGQGYYYSRPVTQDNLVRHLVH
jgi:diguanylate cyclase (GGDEF)-like protein